MGNGGIAGIVDVFPGSGKLLAESRSGYEKNKQAENWKEFHDNVAIYDLTKVRRFDLSLLAN
jgi:hypothetical protein